MEMTLPPYLVGSLVGQPGWGMGFGCPPQPPIQTACPSYLVDLASKAVRWKWYRIYNLKIGIDPATSFIKHWHRVLTFAVWLRSCNPLTPAKMWKWSDFMTMSWGNSTFPLGGSKPEHANKDKILLYPKKTCLNDGELMTRKNARFSIIRHWEIPYGW